MREETFQNEINRLKETYGPKAYPIERVKILWNAFKTEMDSTFSHAVTLCIGQKRTPPMFQELSDALIEARKSATMARYAPIPGLGIGGMIQHAANANRIADKDFVRACLLHLKHHMKKEITKDQFLEGCLELDKLAGRLKGG